MPGITTERIRNIVVMGHTGSGKTSLTDAMFFTSGGDTRMGLVDQKNSRSDFAPEERERGMSINLSLLPSQWKDHRINILDTPGYPDFRGETVSSALVADLAIIVVSATSGIEVGTRQAWDLAEKMNLPRIIVVNKVDRENVDFNKVCADIANIWGRECIPMVIPSSEGSKVDSVKNVFEDESLSDSSEYSVAVEAIAETDDDLILKYLEGEKLSPEEISKALNPAFKSGSIVPILSSAATGNIGSTELLDLLIQIAPSPDEAIGDKQIVDTSSNFVFKTTADPYVGKLSMFRVFGKPVKSNISLFNSRSGSEERVAQVFQVAGEETIPVDELITGDIGVVSKLNETGTFDTLVDSVDDPKFPSPELPEAVFSLAISPESQSDLDKMTESISRICDEDPTLKVERNPETGETILHGLGDIHVETAIERVKRKFDVSLNFELPSIAYRETIFSQAKTEYRHKKQSGGHGQYGHVIMQLAPGSRGSGIKFQSKVVGGKVPRDYVPAVEKGVRKAAAEGVIAGYEVVDVDVTLVDGSSHSVDSSSMAFEIAGSMGFRQGMKDASPQLLEPVLAIQVTAPESSAGDVISDLNGRRARILNVDSANGVTFKIDAQVPAASMQRYSAELRSLTQAQGDFMASFAHYDPVPPDYNVGGSSG